MTRISYACRLFSLVSLVVFISYQCESNIIWGKVYDRYGHDKAAEIIHSLHLVSKWCVGTSPLDENSVSWAPDLDECCKQLWECDDFIPAGSWQYGLFNNRQFSAFLCECEDRFMHCLKGLLGASSIAGQVVYNSYFHLTNGGCFMKLYETECTARLYYNDEGYGFTSNPDHKYFCPVFQNSLLLFPVDELD